MIEISFPLFLAGAVAFGLWVLTGIVVVWEFVRTSRRGVIDVNKLVGCEECDDE